MSCCRRGQCWKAGPSSSLCTKSWCSRGPLYPPFSPLRIFLWFGVRMEGAAGPEGRFAAPGSTHFRAYEEGATGAGRASGTQAGLALLQIVSQKSRFRGDAATGCQVPRQVPHLSH